MLCDVGLAPLEQLGVAMLKGEVQALDAVPLVEVLGHKLAAGSLDSLKLEHSSTETDGVCIVLGDSKHGGVDERDEELYCIDVEKGITQGHLELLQS